MLRRVLYLQIDDNAFIRGGAAFALTLLITALSHAFKLRLDVNATNRAVFACDEPLIDTIAMEQMHTW